MRSTRMFAAAVAIMMTAAAAATASPAAGRPVPAPGAAGRALSALDSGTVTAVRDTRGRVRQITTAHGRSLAAKVAGLSHDAQAAADVADFGSVFGIADPGHTMRAVSDTAQGSYTTVRFQQTNAGLPVLGGQLVVTVDRSGGLVAINGEGSSLGTTFTGTPAISAAAAATTAIASAAKGTGVKAGQLSAGTSTLAVFDPAVFGLTDPFPARRVWQFTVRSAADAAVEWMVLVDAATGSVALSFSQIAYDTAPHRTVCNFFNVVVSSPACPGAFGVARSEGQAATGVADVDNAYLLTGAVHNFYESLGRNGIDDNDLPLVSTVNYCLSADECPLQNAFWNGSQMAFGSNFSTGDDVVGHEMTHGVTQYTSGLWEYYQSGTINESMSDVMGEMFDQLNYFGSADNDSAAARWYIGENLPIGAIRYMADPTQDNPPDPDSMASPNWDPNFLDEGGVHADTGVGNKAAYLATDGGTFRGVTVRGIGDDMKIARIWLAADELMTPGSDYADLAYALEQGCGNLWAAGVGGITGADCTSIASAVRAVSMTSPPSVEGARPEAAMCTSPGAPSNLFFDAFNRSASTSLGSAWTESGSASITSGMMPAGSAGNELEIPEPNPDTGVTRYAYTSGWVTLPSSATSYLHFRHLESLDWSAGTNQFPLQYADGGFVDVDVNGDGQSWIPLSGSWLNGPSQPITYDGGSHTGFGGDSMGWEASRATLSSYAGKQVKFRFRLETDGAAAISTDYGWFLDNVRVYTCTRRAVGQDFNGDGYGDVVTGEPFRAVNGFSEAGAFRIAYGTSSGLTSAGSQFYAAGSAGVPGSPVSGAEMGTTSAAADFNGDGYADVAVGTPYGGAGSVTVLYGSAEGVNATSASRALAQRIVATQAGAPSDTGDAFGRDLATGDFNDDGYGDMAVGAYGIGGGSGGVAILYGGASGLLSGGAQWFTQDTAGVPGASESGDGFGESLAAGDFDGDGSADLAIGALWEDVGSITDAGSITVLYGSASGVTTTGSVSYSQDTASVPGSAEAGDAFGSSLSAGDLDGDGRADLVVGALLEDVGSLADAGSITEFFGSPGGITASGSKTYTQDTSGVPGSAEAGDSMGITAIGDFNGDGYADLVIGMGFEDDGSSADAGALIVMKGSKTGITTSGAVSVTQDSSGMLGTAEAGDLFGYSVKALKLNTDSRVDLVIGVPGEGTDGFSGNGEIAVMLGSSSGLTATGNQAFTSAALVGEPMTNASLGASVG